MQKNPQYKASRKRNPTPDDVAHDIRIIARKCHVYMKEVNPDTDYFWERIQMIRTQSYYYALRMESLGYRYMRAKRQYKTNRNLLKIA